MTFRDLGPRSKVYQREPTFEFLEGTIIYSGHIKIMSSDIFFFVRDYI